MALREFQEKKTAHKLIFSWPVLITITVFSLWMIYGIVSATVTLRELSQKNGEIEKKIVEIQKSKKALEEKASLLETEYGVDLEARRSFNLKKLGEEIILFVDE